MTALALGSFADEDGFRDALARAGEDGHRVISAWSPYPVELPGTPGRERIVAVATTAGLLSVVLFVAFEWWSAVIDYRFNAGGRPFASWAAFLVAPVEVGALVAGIAGVVMLIVRARLGRLHHPAFDIAEVEPASRDRFVVALACDEGEDGNAALAMLARAGALHTRIVER